MLRGNSPVSGWETELIAVHCNEMEGREVCKGAVVERDQEIKIGPHESEASVRHSSLRAALIGIRRPTKHREVTWNDKRLGLLTGDPSHLRPSVLGCPATGPPQGRGHHIRSLWGQTQLTMHRLLQ